MGPLLPHQDQPEDCQTSEAAQRIADTFRILGESRMGDDGMTCSGSHFSASSAWDNFVRYQDRADELRRQGK